MVHAEFGRNKFGSTDFTGVGGNWMGAWTGDGIWKGGSNWIIDRGRDEMLVKNEEGRIVDIDTDFPI